MAIDRFQNPNIVTDSKVPVSNVQTYSIDDSDRLDKTTEPCSKSLLDDSIVEKHIYSRSTLVESNTEPLSYESSNGGNGTYDVLLSPETDIRLSTITKGYYSIVYNFLKNVVPSLKVENISTDSTEVQLSAGTFRNIQTFKQNPLSELRDLVDGEANYKLNLVLNFGQNRLYTITDISFDVELGVVVKLYKPLPSNLENEFSSIDVVVRESYIERISVYEGTEAEENEDFSTPNFKIDVGTYGGSKGTDFKTWNTLLDANLSTSQQIIDKYISGSFGNIELNIDYTYFGNFVKYSSAVERVNNFKYKLELIESYNGRITTLESVSGSEAITNISQSITRRDNVISGMDGWERWMYHEATGSLYTHYSSSNYVISPWPKQSTYPMVNYSVNSSEGISHYNGLISSASVYDALNDSRLTKVIPSSIVEEPLNLDYILFVDMIGHHFDITWSYIKALTSINDREEHPYDGIPNEMLYDTAKAMGWKLSHGKQRSDLWKFVAGTDKLGNPIQSGSLKSKSDEQITYEVWRRIVNNIPYLLKTKGSARAVKALISTYGIPQSFLSIKEYGGPVVSDVKPLWEHDRFVYHLRFDGSNNYINVPWDSVTDTINTIELFVQQNLNRTTTVLNKGTDFVVMLEPTASSNNGNIHLYLSGSSGYKSASISDVPIFDSKMGTLLVQRKTAVNDITQNNEYKLIYRKNRKDEISVSKSSTISVDGSTEASYNAAWTGSGTLTIGKELSTTDGISLSSTDSYLSGLIQEIRYWTKPLNDTVIDEHTLSRESYHSNQPTSSYYDLKFRFIPDSQIKSVTDPDGILSQHPNQKVTSTDNGYPISASLFGFQSSDLAGVTEEYYTRTPSVGSNNILTNKVRVEANTLSGILDVDTKKERSQYDTAPVDTNKVGVYLSATRMYDEDIYNHTGFFDGDDYFGSPDIRPGYNDGNPEFDNLRRLVFQKYSSKNLINDTIDMLARYDFSIFEQIRQTLPARVDYDSGILIEPHTLERPKAVSRVNVSYTQPKYDTTLDVTSTTLVSAQRDDIVSVANPQIKDMYSPSTYRYTILNYSEGADVGFGANWNTGSNGYWNYEPTASSALNGRESKYAKSEVFFYDTALSASLRLSNSSSLVPSVVSTDNLPLALNNLRYLGCKMTSDSLTTDSPDTPDGKPVIEVFTADPNVLIYTSQTADAGNLDVDTNTNLSTLRLEDLKVNEDIKWSRMMEERQRQINERILSVQQTIDRVKQIEGELGRSIVPHRDIVESEESDFDTNSSTKSTDVLINTTPLPSTRTKYGL